MSSLGGIVIVVAERHRHRRCWAASSSSSRGGIVIVVAGGIVIVVAGLTVTMACTSCHKAKKQCAYLPGEVVCIRCIRLAKRSGNALMCTPQESRQGFRNHASKMEILFYWGAAALFMLNVNLMSWVLRLGVMLGLGLGLTLTLTLTWAHNHVQGH